MSLLKAKKFSNVLRFSKQISIEFDPWDARVSQLRILIDRLGPQSRPRIQNPACQVNVRLNQDRRDPLVIVEFDNGKSIKIPAAQLPAQNILHRIEENNVRLEIEKEFDAAKKFKVNPADF
eukprot:TRINITY_DN7289_c0_g1::TRINITY_DN7289_c0_g1_i1::g.8371::m.8371 TRINITY_DN7289_c0_g1::TRINITY_DN7289_c0_g1_i1::g.8371  ORF type:complete len:121 (-),score=15.91,MRP_L53/PF10780.4/7.6e-05,L51_S25_CI-B8/PF05047.11/0.03 TRINITY_DN7289_c0_g1_i1:3-365(-)